MQLAPLVHSLEKEAPFRNKGPERGSLLLRLSLRVDELDNERIKSFAKLLPNTCKEADIPIRRIDWVKMESSSFWKAANAVNTLRNFLRRKSNQLRRKETGEGRYSKETELYRDADSIFEEKVEAP